MTFSRRSMLLITAGLSSSRMLQRPATAQAGVAQESDTNAQALGHKTRASKLDKAKSATFPAGQACASCQYFQGKAGDAMAPCAIFAGKHVNAKGWCSASMNKG